MQRKRISFILQDRHSSLDRGLTFTIPLSVVSHILSLHRHVTIDLFERCVCTYPEVVHVTRATTSSIELATSAHLPD